VVLRVRGIACLRRLLSSGANVSGIDAAAPLSVVWSTMRINRFGVYATDEITVTPEQYDAYLPDLTLDPEL
jgi:hypothetical protein